MTSELNELGFYDQDLIQIGRSLFVYTKHTMKFGDDVIINQGEVSIARAQVENYARTVADSDISVLITGPTGAGKEHLAALVHESSGRMGPIITVNCRGPSPQISSQASYSGTRRAHFRGRQQIDKDYFALRRVVRSFG